MSDAPPVRPAESPAGPPGAAVPKSRWAALLAAVGLKSAEHTGGLGVSLAVHGVVLLAAALWVVDSQIQGGGLTLSLRPGTDEEVSLQEIDTAADLAGSSPPVLTAPPLELTATDGPGLPVELLTATAAAGTDDGAGAGTAEGDGSGDGAQTEKITLPGGGKALRAGSFTVWTVPPDPRPGEHYAIIIEVDLPPELRLRRYPKRDLYGEVKGSDNYRQRLPGDDRNGFLPIRNGKVQYAVAVPGAERLVKDRVKVGSRLLKESQTLELVF